MCNEVARRIALGVLHADMGETRVPLTFPEGAPNRLTADIAAAGWSTVIVMEGGYAVDALGGNVASFLSGF